MKEQEGTPQEDPEREQIFDPPTMRLAKAAQGGSKESFDKLYERLAPSLFSWARLRIPPSIRPFLDEQDVVQEVWLRAVSIIDRYDPEKVNFRAWIFRVAKNVLLEAIRKLRADPRMRMESGPSTRIFVVQNCPDSITLMSVRMRRDEGIKIFTDYIDNLSSPDREILIHSGLEGLSAQEVADRLNLTRESVTKRWQRLRETLRSNGMLKEIIIDESH